MYIYFFWIWCYFEFSFLYISVLNWEVWWVNICLLLLISFIYWFNKLKFSSKLVHGWIFMPPLSYQYLNQLRKTFLKSPMSLLYRHYKKYMFTKKGVDEELNSPINEHICEFSLCKQWLFLVFYDSLFYAPFVFVFVFVSI